MQFTSLFVFAVVLVAEAPAVRASRWQCLADAYDHLHSGEDSEAAVAPNFNGAEDVTFYLYTQGNPVDPEFIKMDDDSSSPSFNPNNPTRFAIHGWIASAQEHIGYREAYIATGDEYNVVLVDWSGLAAAAVPAARNSSLLVGAYVGRVINHLVAARGLDPGTLAIIGHSMGAHVAGIAGNRAGGDRVVAEVVGLDPAGDIYDDEPLENQLDFTDAKFVEIIHTNAGGAGLVESGRGHVDFYPNGGAKQPGCSTLAELTGCSHNRAVYFYWESIVSKSFVATKCSSYEEYTQGACSSNEHVLMGEWTPLTVSGVYYLETNAQSPYAQGHIDL